MRDETLAFAREGYLFGTRRFDRAGGDRAETRLAGRPMTLLRGAEAARFFYEGGRFTRAGAMPKSVQHLLQDEGSVQALEGAAHDRRKQLFLGLLTGPGADELVGRFRSELMLAALTSPGEERRLIDVFSVALLRAVSAWAGIPVAESVALERSRALQKMVAAAGSVGPVNWEARARRRSAERLLAEAVVRQRAYPVAETGTAFAVIAGFREPERGELLTPEVAAVELLNILRPTVAVAWFLTFAALALHRRPTWRERLASAASGAAAPGVAPTDAFDDGGELRWFSNEVRRFYPFFPFVAGRASRELEWGGRFFEPGDRVALDLYATDHHPALWEAPGRFDPERFAGRVVEPNTLIPQGGGRYREDHRCPGEPVTLALLDEGVRMLVQELDYSVPEQDLRVSLRRFPALPEDGMRVTGLAAR